MTDNKSCHAETLTLINLLLPYVDRVDARDMTASEIEAYDRLVARIDEWGITDA